MPFSPSWLIVDATVALSMDNRIEAEGVFATACDVVPLSFSLA